MTPIGIGIGIGLGASVRGLQIPLLSRFPGAVSAWSSVVNLNGDPDFKAVRLRRSSDDAEQDFTIKEIHDGTAQAWVNTPVITYQSDFTSGNEDFGERNSTSQDGQTIDGVADAYKLTIDTTTSIHDCLRSSVFPEMANYRVEFDYYIPSSNSNVDGIKVLNINSSWSVSLSVLDTWTPVSETFTQPTGLGQAIYLRMSDGGVDSFLGNGTDYIAIKNMVITQLTANAYIVTEYDQTGNGNHRTNVISTQQPLLFEAGVLNTDSGWPCAKLDGSNDNLTGTMPATTGSMLIANSIGADVWEVDIPAGSYSLLPSAGVTKYPLRPVAQVVWSRTLSDAEKVQVKGWISKYCTVSFSSITSFLWYFHGRSELINQPIIDTSSLNDIRHAWQFTGITELSGLDLSNASGYFAFQGSALVTYNSGPFKTNSPTLLSAFRNTPLQNFPAGIFDNTTGTINLGDAFTNTNLTQQSIDNILVSLNTSGTLNGTFGQSGGSAPSAVGEDAIDDLRSKGWTVTVTGGY